ncbi:hypothetical protein IKG45_03790 [Candidatus Saccharibacteria bacterium]|nr:hypothetical protein [Candidatus Saccharibacteria bacterium]
MNTLKNHQWWFPDDNTASRLFEILMFSELGLIKDFDIFNQFEIKIHGWTSKGEIKTMRVKNMEINLKSKSLYLLCEDNDENVEYCVDLDEAVTQFVKKFWED